MSSSCGFLEKELLESKLPFVKFTSPCGKTRGKALLRTAIANGDRPEAGVGGHVPLLALAHNDYQTCYQHDWLSPKTLQTTKNPPH